MNSTNKNSINYLVCVRCMTYNHAPYIVDAMNGFCMQQTSFPFVCIIIDDASTDGEQEVIRNYLQEHFDLEDKSVVRNEETEDFILTFARNKTNHCCYFAVYFLKYNHYCIKKTKAPYIQEWYRSIKYIALCEGDDYWINQDKLQKQVDFLETHQEYGLIYTDYDEQHDIKGTYTKAMINNGKRPKILSFEEHLIHKSYIAPMSWLFRKEFRDLILNYKGPKYTDGSFILALEIFLHTKVYYYNESMCVYRVHAGSATNQVNSYARFIYARGVYDTQMYYLEKYNLKNKFPHCCDWYYNSYYCHIIVYNEKKMFPFIKSFFKRASKNHLKYALFYLMMLSKFSFPVLKFICKKRIG